MRGHRLSPFYAADFLEMNQAVRQSRIVVADGARVRVEFFAEEGKGLQACACEFEGITRMDELDAAIAAKDVIMAQDTAHVYGAFGVHEISWLHDANAGDDGVVRQDGGLGVIRAPMHGKLTVLLVQLGDQISRGQRLAIVEAMKMEHVLSSPVDGVIGNVNFAAGDQVTQGAQIMNIEQPQHEAKARETNNHG